MMARNKQHRKNDANTGKVPQEVAKEDSRTLKSVSNDDIQHRWHESVRNLPPGQIIDIPYLKQLAMKTIVPIAYCKNPDIDKVKNFVPAYLQRFTRNIWQLLDEKKIVLILSQHNWDDGDDSILKLFGTFMQHPEDNFVIYFGGTPEAEFEEEQPLFKEGSPHRSPRKNPEQRSPARSPMKTPYCGCAAGTQCKAPPSANLADSPHSCWGCNKKIHSAQKLNARISDMLAVPPPTGINMTFREPWRLDRQQLRLRQ